MGKCVEQSYKNYSKYLYFLCEKILMCGCDLYSL